MFTFDLVYDIGATEHATEFSRLALVFSSCPGTRVNSCFCESMRGQVFSLEENHVLLPFDFCTIFLVDKLYVAWSLKFSSKDVQLCKVGRELYTWT